MLSQVTRLSSLHVVQVQVDRVRVHPVVGDLPDLRAIAADS